MYLDLHRKWDGNNRGERSMKRQKWKKKENKWSERNCYDLGVMFVNLMAMEMMFPDCLSLFVLLLLVFCVSNFGEAWPRTELQQKPPEVKPKKQYPTASAHVTRNLSYFQLFILFRGKIFIGKIVCFYLLMCNIF